jgi:hypothetical protein
MTTKIYIKDKGFLDLFEDVQIPLNYSLADVSSIDKRNSSYSKTIILPGSKRNNQILGNIFDVNINFLDADFQINRKVEAIIFQNDVPVLKGWFKLLKINKISPASLGDENIEYEAVVFSNQSGLFDVIKDDDVASIDLSEGNHILSFAEITGSTTNTWRDGWKYIWHYTSDDKYRVSDFRPAFYVKKLWDKIFENAGFTYTSDFLNDEPFTKLLIPTNTKDLLISDEEKAKRECRVSFPTGYTVTNVNNFTKTASLSAFPNVPISQGGFNAPTNLMSSFSGFFLNPTQMVQLKFNDDTTGINFDGSYDNYDTSNFYFQAPKTGSYEFELNLGGNFSITVPDEVYIQLLGTQSNPRQYTEYGKPAFDIIASFEYFSGGTWIVAETAQKYYEFPTVNKSVTFPNIGTQTVPGLNSGTTTAAYSFKPEKFIVQMNQGWLFRIRFKVITYATIIYTTSTLQARKLTYNFTINGYNTSNSFLKVNAVKNNLSTGDEIQLNELIPKNVKQVDFIKSIVNMFNLYLIPDEDNDKNIIVKTRDEFYADFASQYLDWSDKLDYSQEYSLTLLSELQQKSLNFTWKQASDEVSKRYREQTGFEYGQYKLNFDNDFLTGERKIEPIFEPTPLVKTLLPLGDEGASFIVPYLQYGKETAPKILYDGGNIATTDYELVDVDASGNTISYMLDYYAYAGHFDNPTQPNFDLNWNVNQVYFYNEVLDNITLNNLYNLYWFNYVNLIAQSKLLTGYFRLNELDIAQLNFAKLIWIKDSYWILNKIVDYNANENGLTKVELIKSVESPKYNSSYTQVSPVLSDVQTTSPIRWVGGDVLTNNQTTGISGNDNWGSMSLINGRNNTVRTFVKNSNVTGNNNVVGISSENVNIIGNSNFIGGNSVKINITGDFNNVGGGCANISLMNCNNVKVLNGVKNISVINANDLIISEDNITISNEFYTTKESYSVKNASILDAGEDIVFETKAAQIYPIDIVDSLEDLAFSFEEDTDIIDGGIDGTIVNFDEYL